MTTLKDIYSKNIKDCKKAKLLETILLEKSFKCFVEVDPKYVRITEHKNHHSLTKEKVYEILELENIEIEKIITEIGMYNIIYIPIPS